MKKSFLLLVIVMVMLAACAAAVFVFSSQNGEETHSVSGAIAEKVAPVFSSNYYELSGEEQNQELKRVDYIVRKIAHVAIYAFLAFLITLFSGFFNIKNIFRMGISVGVCTLFAAADEIIQYFTPGRYGAVKDVFIDFFGAVIGMLVGMLILYVLKRCNKKSPLDI